MNSTNPRLESAETVSLENTGTIVKYDVHQTATILASDGKRYYVRPWFSIEMEEYCELAEWMPVRFEIASEPEKSKKWPLMIAKNVRIDHSATVSDTAAKTSGILDVTNVLSGSLETKIASLRSIIQHGNEAVESGKDYRTVKSHVDAAYSILRTIDEKSLSEDEKAAFEEVGGLHNDLTVELAMMDEPAE